MAPADTKSASQTAAPNKTIEAQGLNLTCIAEGVETDEQLQILKAYGCDHVQGFLFHRPTDGTAAEAFLRANQAESMELQANIAV